MKNPKRRPYKWHDPLYANMQIYNSEREDPVTRVPQLTDDAVKEGRDWVEYLRL